MSNCPARAGFTASRRPGARCVPGIIPARAGFTTLRTVPCSTPTDHPRSRGVYSVQPLIPDAPWGSSPLARGLPNAPDDDFGLLGIIPARAGFTNYDRFLYADTEDHPRSRGVYPNEFTVNMMRGGSSPLARGLLQPVVRVGAGGRIIPARAGFTRSAHPRAPAVPDHPRSRGVYGRLMGQLQDAAGSSPLARGLRVEGAVGEGQRGIIPARAGFTVGGHHTLVGDGDHPRSRGVYVASDHFSVLGDGSSPLARGLL